MSFSKPIYNNYVQNILVDNSDWDGSHFRKQVNVSAGLYRCFLFYYNKVDSANFIVARFYSTSSKYVYRAYSAVTTRAEFDIIVDSDLEIFIYGGALTASSTDTADLNLIRIG